MYQLIRARIFVLPTAWVVILACVASGCDTISAFVTRFNEIRAVLKSHGIEFHHGKMLYVTWF